MVGKIYIVRYRLAFSVPNLFDMLDLSLCYDLLQHFYD